MDKLVAIILALAAGCLLAVSAELNIKEKKLPCERLASNVMPTEYLLQLNFTSTMADSYNGQVDISLKIPHKKDHDHVRLSKGLEGETCKMDKSDTIVLHADSSVKVEEVTVKSNSCGAFGCFQAGGLHERSIRSIKRDSEKQLLAIKLKRGFSAGDRGTLSIRFSGRVRQDKRGVYLSTFNDGKREYKHIVSQFQPTDARLVFPVFDEPRFKARFQLRIVHPNTYTALSNTQVAMTGKIEVKGPTELAQTIFKQTPSMSPHMVAFTFGEFDEPLEVTATSAFAGREYKVRVYTAPGLRESGRFALDVAQQSLNYFENYIESDYPLDKFDIVAIADLERDNTESWGLAFIRDTLVWIDDETKPDTNITTAVNVAHVCVHQWFGNLVTVAWWNDLWITEGVAAQFAFRLVRDLYPEFQSEYFVRLATLSGVMQLDAPGDQHALAPALKDLRSSQHIYEMFDNVEFMKSAALAQMIAKWADTGVGDWYTDVLRRIVSEYSYRTITNGDYLIALHELAQDYLFHDDSSRENDILPYLVNLIDSFSAIHGVPVLNAKLDGDNLTIDVELMQSARKDIADPFETQSQWIMVYDDVLVQYAEAQRQKRSPTTVPESLGFTSDRELTLKVSDFSWAKVSSQPDIHTYFRVRYSPNLYQALCEPISARSISAMDRLQILDDANVLAQAHLISSDTFRQLVDCYADEDDGAVLLELMVALKTLASLKGSSPSSKAVLNIFTKHGFAATGKETFLEQRSRQVILKALITQGNQQVIEAALKAFDEAQGNVALFLREPVYAAVAAHGTEAQAKQLKDKLTTTKSYEEKLRLANALVLSSDTELLRYTRLWLDSGSGLKREVLQPLISLTQSKAK